MRTEKGVILVVFKRPGRSSRYAVLKRNKKWDGWEIPKGHLEKEGFEETVKQELREETGIEKGQIEEMKKLDHTVKWSYEDEGEEVRKEYSAYVLKVDDSSLINVDNNPHEEHEKGHFFNYNDARTLLTYEDQKELLDRARQVIKEEF